MFLADETCIVSIESSLLLRQGREGQIGCAFFPASTTRKRTFRGSGTDMGEEDGTSSRFSCWSSSVTRTTGGTRIDLVRRGPPPTLWKAIRFLLLSFLLNVMFYIKHLSYYLNVLFKFVNDQP